MLIASSLLLLRPLMFKHCEIKNLVLLENAKMQHLLIVLQNKKDICSVEFHCFQVHLDEEVF